MPIYSNCAQGSTEWLIARTGKPTASEFHKIVTPGGKISKQCEGYLYSLLAEIVVGHPITGPETDWMSRGVEMEQDAVSAYEFHTGRDTSLVGFVTTDDGLIGASPDRLIADEGLLEIKCPAPKTHVCYMLTGCVEDDYAPQIQGQLLVTERKWVEIVSYHPEMPPVIIRVQRDEHYIALLRATLGTFVDLLSQRRAELEARYGKFTLRVQATTPQPEIGGPYGVLTEEDLEAIIAAKFPNDVAVR